MPKRKRDANKVIVVGLPKGYDSEKLEQLCEEYGKVYGAHVVGYDASTGDSRGYGFVTFADAEACTKAVENLNKSQIGERVINVRLVEDRDQASTSLGKDATKIIVAGLSQTMDEERLKTMCEEFGLVLKAAIVRGSNGKSKGFGFVTFTNKTSQQAAIQKLDKRELGGGRVLNVRAVEPRNHGGAKNEEPSASSSTVETTESSAGADTGEVALVPVPTSEVPEGVCVRFQFGKCHRGKSCRWEHIKVEGFVPLPKTKKKKVPKSEKVQTSSPATEGDFDAPGDIELVTKVDNEKQPKRVAPSHMDMSAFDDDEDEESSTAPKTKKMKASTKKKAKAKTPKTSNSQREDPGSLSLASEATKSLELLKGLF